MAITWDKILDVPEGTVLTDETIDAFILAFEQRGTAKQRGTSGGTYPSGTLWTASNYSIPEGVSFGTKRIPGANPFYFVNKEDEQGQVFPEFGIVEQYDPSETYRFVEYLKSTGTQYIVTDIVPTYSTRTELDCKFDVTNYDNVNVVFFGIQTGGDSKWYLASLEKGSSSLRRNCSFYIGFQWYSGISSVTITDVLYSSRNIVVCHHPRSAYGSNTITITEQITQQQPDVGVTFFGVTNTSGTSGRAFDVGNMYLYGAKMYDGNLSHNLIPVERVQDNELGLLDVMTGEFYTNTGTGTFEKGSYVD